MNNNFSLYDNYTAGEIEVRNNDIQVTGSIYTMIYTRWFGGNYEASTTDPVGENEDRHDFWGNNLLLKDKPELQFNSKLEKKLRNTALNSSGILSIERVATEDLKYLTDLANIVVQANLIDVDRLELQVFADEPENTQNLVAQFIWDATKKEPIIESELPSNPEDEGKALFENGDLVQFENDDLAQFENQ